MEIRKGNVVDIEKIMEIISCAIDDMEAEEIYQWDDIYPNEKVIRNDINEGNLYIYIEENSIKAFITLNELQDQEYESISWKVNEGKNLIIHRLCVSPKYKGKGIATALIKYAEQVGIDKGYASIRLDAFKQNRQACSLYKNNGYEERGTVRFRKGEFYCFEKKLCSKLGVE
jgi:ribosomal protein S18 acetylase RimI-like enzyme